MPKQDFRRLSGNSALPADLRGGVVAVGNFDGVHRGHQSVLDQALECAATTQVPAIVLTFEPHPRVLFRPEVTLPRITPAPMRARLLDLLGFDAVVEQQFDRAYASNDAESFVIGTLVEGLAISHVVTGFDFHFGRRRQGGPAYLMEAGKRLGFGVTLVDAFRDEGAAIVSSSAIRECLAAGDVAAAAALLGYRHTVSAPVIHGQKLGRTLGYPTANMMLPADTALRHGIYAVRLRRQGGAIFDGVASFGRRPTVVDDGAALLETYVFDFADDLYGETCEVSFFAYLRGELKFDGLEPLMVQMRQDEAQARAILAGVQPLTPLDRAVAFDGLSHVV